MPRERGGRPRTKPGAAYRPSADVDGGSDGDLVVELDHVRDGHAHAAVGGGAAKRTGVVGPVDPGAVIDAHPARLERVVGRAAGNHLAGEVAGPVRVRDAPGRVDRLVLNRVLAGRGVEADGA